MKSFLKFAAFLFSVGLLMLGVSLRAPEECAQTEPSTSAIDAPKTPAGMFADIDLQGISDRSRVDLAALEASALAELEGSTAGR